MPRSRARRPRTPFVLLFLLLLASGVAAAKGRPAKGKAATSIAPVPHGLVYTVDDAHSYVEFSARLLGFNRVRGTFPDYSVHVYFDPDSVTSSAVSARIAVAGVSTHVDERDHHLESADFFDAARFPYIRFESRTVTATPEGFVVSGDLTIRDVTKTVEIPFAITSPLATDPFGNPRFSTAGHVVISRRDFGVNGPKFWNNAIGDSIEIDFEVGARRWNWDTLGFGSKRTSIGQRLLALADSLGIERALRDGRALWTTEHANPAWNFGLFEYSKAAGRLGQHDRPRDGAAVLAQGIELAADSSAAGDVAALRCQRAELLLKAGDLAGAREELGRATAADSTSTYVHALRHVIG